MGGGKGMRQGWGKGRGRSWDSGRGKGCDKGGGRRRGAIELWPDSASFDPRRAPVAASVPGTGKGARQARGTDTWRLPWLGHQRRRDWPEAASSSGGDPVARALASTTLEEHARVYWQSSWTRELPGMRIVEIFAKCAAQKASNAWVNKLFYPKLRA